MNGWAVTDVTDPTGAVLKAGQQLAGFGQLKDDGSTASGCWIFSGSWTEQGNQMARRDNSDPYGMHQVQNWAWAWPANRRILYNRASSDPQGKPWDPEKKRLVWWNGKAWTGTDVPDFKVDSPPEAGMNPFIMNPEGVARFFAIDKMAEGPFPSTTSRSRRRLASTRCTRRTRRPPVTRPGGYSTRCGTPSASTTSSRTRRPRTG